MKINRIQRVLILGALAAAVSGCATSPMSKNIRTEAKATRDISFARISSNPTAYKGEEVIWGGEIVNVLNEPSASKIYLSEIPLQRSGEPLYPAQSPGTFIAIGRSSSIGTASMSPIQTHTTPRSSTGYALVLSFPGIIELGPS